MELHLPFGIRRGHLDNSTTITKDEYQKMSKYAADNLIKIEGFKKFNGDINDIMELIDDITEIAKDFPRILEGRKSLIVSLDVNSSEDDFATTIGHIVYLNSKLYCDIQYLNSEYNLAVSQGKFVANTDYHGVIRHELGHVIANIYGFDTMEIAKKVLPEMHETEIIKFVKSNVSSYAADYSDGREFISECFSAYYGGVANSFESNYVAQCKKLAKEELND